MANFCENCGALLESGAKFCMQCGTQAESDQQKAREPGLIPTTAVSKSRSSILLWGMLAALAVVIVAGTFFLFRFRHGTPDSQIVQEIKAAFFNDENIRKCTIDVTAQNGVVTLVGLVNSDADKASAVRIAGQQQGVRQVVHHLAIQPAGVSPTTAPRTDSGGPIRTIEVPGNQAWTPTGVFLSVGNVVEISASGAIAMSAGSAPTLPAGSPPDCGGGGGFPAGEVPCWSLIGRIGEQGAIFYVGSKITFQAPTSGQLFLGVNDNVLGDNSGSWTATVIVQPRAGAVTTEVSPTPNGPQPGNAAIWLGFANETSPQDREAELHQNCSADFRRVYVPLESGNRFTDLCRNAGKTCERVCDWQGTSFSCSAVSRGGGRDGSRIALCR